MGGRERIKDILIYACSAAAQSPWYASAPLRRSIEAGAGIGLRYAALPKGRSIRRERRSTGASYLFLAACHSTQSTQSSYIDRPQQPSQTSALRLAVHILLIPGAQYPSTRSCPGPSNTSAINIPHAHNDFGYHYADCGGEAFLAGMVHNRV